MSPRVNELLEKTFAAPEWQAARELIGEFDSERLHLDILEICGGSLKKVADLVKIGQQDWRDLIVAAEYDLIGGDYVQNSRGRARSGPEASDRSQRRRT